MLFIKKKISLYCNKSHIKATENSHSTQNKTKSTNFMLLKLHLSSEQLIVSRQIKENLLRAMRSNHITRAFQLTNNIMLSIKK